MVSAAWLNKKSSTPGIRLLEEANPNNAEENDKNIAILTVEKMIKDQVVLNS